MMVSERVVPDSKISEFFLGFAEPLLGDEHRCPTPEEVAAVLKLAFAIWNAVVVDTVRGTTEFVEQLREQLAEHPRVSALLEQMIRRKQNLFSHDLRRIERYKLLRRDGEWRVGVEACGATAK